MSKVCLELRDETCEIQIVDREDLDVLQPGEISAIQPAELVYEEHVLQSSRDKDPREKGEITKFVCPPEGLWPLAFFVASRVYGGTEGFMEMLGSGKA